MRTVYIRLPDIRTVQAFVNALSSLPGRFDLVSGHYLLDAKSLLGIVSLDRTKRIRLEISEDTPETMRTIEQFMIKDESERGEKSGE